jgi:hypothetical protein
MVQIRFFDSLPADHPLVRDCVPCFFCNKAFLKGDITCLVPAQELDPAGPAYQVLEAKVVHAACMLAKEVRDGTNSAGPQ